MREPFERRLFHEYFYKKLCELDDDQAELVRALRTKKGMLVLCDQLRALEIEKTVVMRLYEELKQFF